MKVFSFDTKTGKRGEQVGTVGTFDGQGMQIERAGVILPLPTSTENWMLADSLEYRAGRETLNLRAEDFGAAAVCVCIGEFSAGSGPSVWEWVVILSAAMRAGEG